MVIEYTHLLRDSMGEFKAAVVGGTLYWKDRQTKSKFCVGGLKTMEDYLNYRKDFKVIEILVPEFEGN